MRACGNLNATPTEIKMRVIQATVAALFLLLSVFIPAFADALPNTGTYFIVSKSSGEAIQPVGGTPGQSVLLYPFNKGGLQKWSVKRHIDPKTKQPTNRYNISLAGETPDLDFQPHDIQDRAALITPGKSVMVLEAKGEDVLVKSVKRNGDALFVYPYPPMNSEARFGPSDDSAKFLWDFIAAD
jgi:hypothetical protein